MVLLDHRYCKTVCLTGKFNNCSKSCTAFLSLFVVKNSLCDCSAGFPRQGATTTEFREKNYYSEICMKMKEIGLKGEGVRP